MDTAPINRNNIRVHSLRERRSFIDIRETAIEPDSVPPPAPAELHGQIDELAHRINHARRRQAAAILTYGAHTVKNGLAPVMGALLKEGWISHLATQGAGIIHDWEFAFAGVSSESVRDNAPIGRFGMWDETGTAINIALLTGAAANMGFGEAVGKFITEDGCRLPSKDELHAQICDEPDASVTAPRAELLHCMDQFGYKGGWLEMQHPYKDYSLTAMAYQAGVPLTVHPGIGYDIFANHPLFHGGATGRCAGLDTRVFAQSVKNLTNGVYLSVGSAIMSPQVFEKAFSLANNVRETEHCPFIKDHFMAVVDLQEAQDWDWTKGEPPEQHPAYYLRFMKSFSRLGGTLDYINADNRIVLHNLLHRLRNR